MALTEHFQLHVFRYTVKWWGKGITSLKNALQFLLGGNLGVVTLRSGLKGYS